MIPKIIHFIFYGFTEFEYTHYLAVKSALSVHKGWHVKIHCAKIPHNNTLWNEVAPQVELVHCEPPTHFRGVELTSYQYKADITRLELLIQQGGAYMDVDVISLRSFDDLVSHSCVLGVERAEDPNTTDLALVDSITNAVILCEPNHPFIIDMLNKTADNLNNEAWAHHAVKLPLQMLRASKYDVCIQPSKTFMPFDFRDYSLFEKDLTKVSLIAESYTMHMWDTIWRHPIKNVLAQVDNNFLNQSNTLLAEICKQYYMEASEPRRLKIAIYTICKNEEKLIDRWARTNVQADYRLVCDTGSTDGTVDKLKQHGVNTFSISVRPWRFDVARNTSLNLLPEDIDVCIWQDFDEELMPGWYEEIQQHWKPGTTTANHRYRNNDNPWQWHSKIHARHNCRWEGAVHETLVWTGPEAAIWIDNLYLDEHQDTTKNRTGYLQLLETKIAEGDDNWRTHAFLAGEYQSQGMLDKCIEARHKSYDLCNEGDIIKSYCARHMAIVYWYQQRYEDAERWLKKATEHSDEREAWFKLAELYYQLKRWDECYIASRKCLAITTKRDGFTHDPAAWGMLPYDYAALSAYNLGLHSRAIEYGQQAIDCSPEDKRLKQNMLFYQESCYDRGIST